jgi:DNA-binding XRE family transcriptional regulator
MTQQELADRLGVTKQQINTYTREEKPRLMSLETARNIAALLNCEMKDLYEWVPVEVRNKRR